MRIRLLKLAVAVPAALALLIPTAATSQASAVGYQVFGAQCATLAGKTLCFPGATLGHSITGSGKTITHQSASVDDNYGGGTAGGNFCNWRIDWEYRDTNNKVYYTDYGPMHYKCESLYYPIGRDDGTRRVVGQYGAACAVFWANGRRLATQCHHITA
jgi:hypothetical protein